MLGLLIITGFFGAIIGSFLNMVIYRYPIMLKQQWYAECAELFNQPISEQDTAFNFAFPRSHCTKCKKTLPFYYNIPIFSYLLLRGKCAFCQSKIPLRYLSTEILSALLAVVVVWHFGMTIQSAALLIFTWGLITLAMIDIDHQLLPDVMTLSLLWIGLLCSTQHIFISPTQSIIGAATGYLFLWLIAFLYKTLRKQEGMGYGDCKMLAMFGAWTGALPLLNIILVASVLALIVTYGLIFFKKTNHSTRIPFGPYLAIAGWWTVVFGPQLMTWLIKWS